MPLGKGKAWFEEGTRVSFLQDGPLTGFPWTQCCLRWSHGEEEATFHAKLSLYQCSAFFNACTKGLVCYSPWGGKESDMTEWLNWTEEVMGLPGGKDSAWRNARDPGSVPGWGRSPGEGKGNPLQYSCLGNPRDRGAWWATVHRLTKSRLSTKQRQRSHAESIFPQLQ